ncbi:unnamed protein product [Rhizoctonia solani]|uniref:Fungal-type protein kinase domain-containing protein n=1 Tax=Rhizoctonia solani TaxID=456999 RepID=A0A8H2W8G1_9AGAM|nr:unnamed protein product [Rhizoctonia solani]
MAGADVSGLLCSSISSSSVAINEGFPKHTQDILAPSFLEDLKDCQHCDVDQFLSAFLEHCRATDSSTNPSTPRITQSAENSQDSSPSNCSDKTVRQSGKNPEAAPDATTASNRAVDILPVTHELLEVCLEKMIPICDDPKIKASIKHYQESHNEKPRYEPFAALANRVLELIKPLKTPGLRDASTLDILFCVNSSNGITAPGDIARSPDIVVVPLASAQRVRKTQENWNRCTIQPSKRDSFDWRDILLPAEMKWYRHTLDCQQPEAYDTNLKLVYRPIPTYDDGSTKFASILSGESVSNSNTSPGPSVSPSLDLAGSGPTHDSAFLVKCHEDLVEARRTVEMSQPLGARGRKRSSDDLVQQTTKKPTLDKDSLNHKMKKRMQEALKQTAINGAEMLRCSLGRRHALGMIIIDAIVWIWWFDRQGAIQSKGINIIEDLPRFLVLLFAFQRFTLTDWGFDVELDPSVPPRAPLTPQPVQLEFDGEDGKFKVGFTPGPDIMLHNVFNLRGKSTTVFRVTSHLNTNNSGLVAKLYWPNQDRPHEADIIKRARKDPDLVNHLPYVFGSRDLDPVGTRRIRQELGIAVKSPRSPRLPRIILFEELHPITKLSGNEFVFAWLECIRCHYRTWENSIRHLDLSLRNLMLRPRNEPGRPGFFGVVNDWDLGDEIEDKDKKNLFESRKDLTKTLLFTSLDLLAKQDEQVIQRYSHDLESFAWILIWVFLAVEEGEIKPIQEVVGWRTGHPYTSYKERNTYFSNIHKYVPHKEWRPYWRMAWDVAEWLQSRVPKPDPVAFFADEKTEEKDETPEERKESLRQFLKIVEEQYRGDMPSSPEIPGL